MPGGIKPNKPQGYQCMFHFHSAPQSLQERPHPDHTLCIKTRIVYGQTYRS